MPYPSHIARNALRSALRNHRDSALVLSGRLVNSLSLADLKAALAALGLDADRIIADALNGGPIRPRPTAANHTFCARCDSASVDGCTDLGCPHLSRDEMEDHEEPDLTLDPLPEVAAIDPVEAEMQSVRSLIATGGFSAFDDKLRELIIEARKPAVEIMVPGPTVEIGPVGPGIHVAKLTGKSATWRALFGVGGALGKRETQLWDGSHPNTPRVNDRYLWPHPQTETALTQVARGRNVMLYGPAGTGKTEWAQQLAARTGRPFALISCDNGTDAATLVGMTVPDAAGGVTWQDGQLTRAIKTPGCVVCLDEPSVARPGALFVMQNVLANRVLFVAETGARVPVASGVVFIATDNTNGTGGGARRGFTDTNRLNTAFLDRFGVRVKVDYLPSDRETDILVGYTGCTRELAQLLVSAATLTRAAADNQTLSEGIGFRRLLSWAELLMDGIDAENAFRSAVLNCASEQDVETLREQCLLTYDKRTVANALNPAAPVQADPAVTNPTPAGREAGDFTQA
jgi:MoxR-like ATPase